MTLNCQDILSNQFQVKCVGVLMVNDNLLSLVCVLEDMRDTKMCVWFVAGLEMLV